jgi:hypothetical protein
MPKFLVNVSLEKNQLQNAVIHATNPSPSDPKVGQIYYDTSLNKLRVCVSLSPITWADASVVDATTTAKGIVQLAGDLSGTASSPTIATGAVTSAKILDGTIQIGDIDSASVRLDTIASATSDVSVGSSTTPRKLQYVADPVANQDAATKAYVDSAAVGIDWKPSVRVATTASITLSGTQTIDGVAVVANERVLVKDQSSGSQNGIYVVSASGWSRSTDADTSAEVTGGFAVWVNEGSANGDSGWVLTNNDPITLGTTALTFTQFTGLGQITPGTGLSKSGNTISLSTPVSLANGGTNSSTASGARQSIGAPGFYSSATHSAGTQIQILQSTHGLNTNGVFIVQVFEVSSGDLVFPDINVNTTSGTVTINFAASQLANSHRVTIIGQS